AVVSALGPATPSPADATSGDAPTDSSEAAPVTGTSGETAPA
ncbi:PadR family transcriptional regulator, partial [Actinotalea fermentans ATCC 43279 = JCM 9966 = DSM 3133]